MRVAFECSTPLLESIQPFADFDFLLTHKVLEDEEYVKYYKGSNRIKILDNSVNEKGEPCSIDEIEMAVKVIGSISFVIAPDWIGDLNKTLESYFKCLEKFKDIEVIPVVQGNTTQEAVYCASIYTKAAIARKTNLTVSIPYDIGSLKTDNVELMAERRALVVSNIPKEVGIHLLGFTTLNEFPWYETRPNVLSIDTGAPILLGLQCKDILDPIESKEKPTLNQMEELELTEKSWSNICRNIALFRKYTL